MSNDFGKDLGLIHEAVITSRKAGVDRPFWNALAMSEKTCGLIAPLAIHATLVEEVGIDIASIPSEEALREFAEWLQKATGGCAGCLPIQADLTLLGITGNRQNAAKKEIEDEARKRLIAVINKKMEWFGISLAELSMFMGEHDWQGRIIHFEGNLCLKPEFLLRCLLTIRAQRQALLVLASIPRK
jgi:hypothetical protein